MFLIVPYSAELRFGRVPWVVVGTMLLCLVIHYFQDDRRGALSRVFTHHCQDVYDAQLDDSSSVPPVGDRVLCAQALYLLHELQDPDGFNERIRWLANQDDTKYTNDELNDLVIWVRQQYEDIRKYIPPSMDAKLVYDPQHPSLISSLLSALSHADWWHLFGNLLFFFAFAPALELIIASPGKFLGSMIAIEVVCDVAYSFSVLLGAEPLPTLGLSGVVMGMIGMAAYLMPQVKIRTFVWVVSYARTIHIPVIALAVWYVGWDTYYLLTTEKASGINLLAHVAGGYTGYVIARTWFKRQKEESQEEINDEVEYLKSLRRDKLGILSSYTSKTSWYQEQHQQRMVKKEFDEYLDRIFAHIRAGRDSEAIVLLLENYEEHRGGIEIYEEIYNEILAWKQTRTVLCLSRLLISEYLAGRKYRKAIDVARNAFEITTEFAYAEPGQEAFIAALAEQQGLSLTDRNSASFSRTTR